MRVPTALLALFRRRRLELGLRWQIDLLESVVDVLPSSADTPGIPAAFLCRLLHTAVTTEASAKTCRDLKLRVALDADGERVRNTDTVRRVVTAFVERHQQAQAPDSERRRSCRASMFGTTSTELGARPGALEKVAKIVDEVAAEIATEEALPISKFVGVAGAVPKDVRPSHDCLYRAVGIYRKTHPALDEQIQREKVCSIMDPLKLSYQACLHASQNMADAALAWENEALRLELALMRAYMSGIQQSKRSGSADTVPSSPSRTTAKKAGFFGSELARIRAYMSVMHNSKGSGSTPGWES